MFDIGLDRIFSVISTRADAAVDDLISRLKPAFHLEVKSSKPVQTNRAASGMQTSTGQKQLEERKSKLMKQLQTIDHQMRKVKIEQSRIETRKNTDESYNDPEAFKRAVSLVAKMNQKRKQQSLAQQKKSQLRELRIQSSLKQFKQMNEKQQKQRQQKRQQIQQRIQKRREKVLAVQQFSKKSNSLIQQLQSYRISLPNIAKFKNPEEFESSLEKLEPQKSRKMLPKTLPRSPFLERIQQDEMNRKREEYIKSYEKKKVRERQQIYGRKIRKNLKESSLFVTD